MTNINKFITIKVFGNREMFENEQMFEKSFIFITLNRMTKKRYRISSKSFREENCCIEYILREVEDNDEKAAF